MEEQIIAVFEHEAGAKAGDLARKHGGQRGNAYNWKAKYGGDGRLRRQAPEGPGTREREAEAARRPDAGGFGASGASWACRSVGPVPSSVPIAR